ncbi:hypothetical protein [Curtobacterium sp. MCBD17_003]|uniref:hypothetical protein n=1 Tax=Curtobacterium sp. MCBD17_003 TaxID=2175667 RepID=UPI000DA8008B|nr:hypothetical protein [Curtobacterium sp. MCBD17_003]WIE55362.1 hypothetical protein DEI88_003895 [Curtobacterium sp. MCBD17_003]
MQWWNSFIDWSGSAHGWRLISGAIIPFVAIVVAGIVAALIGRGATKRVVAMQEREAKNAAVAGVISAARKAATWGSLGHDERSYADHLAEDADIRLRLLPVVGAPVAANWAQHEIADIKKHSSTFSFQAEQSLSEFRDRMLEWQARPSRARKLFRADLERWKFESPDPDADLVKRQQEWNADQTDAVRAGSGAERGATMTPLRAGRSDATGTTATGTTATGTTAASGTADAAAGGVTVGSGTAPRPAPIAPVLPRVDRSPLPDRAASAARGTLTDRSASADSSTPTDRAPSARPVGTPDREAGADGSAAVAPSGTAVSGTGGTEADRQTAVVPAVALARPSTSERPATQSPTAAPAPAPAQVAPVSADESGEQGRPAGELTDPKVDAAGPATTNTTSIPTRIADAPVEPADPDETDEAPYGSPVSAAELRRRADQDDD